MQFTSPVVSDSGTSSLSHQWKAAEPQIQQSKLACGPNHCSCPNGTSTRSRAFPSRGSRHQPSDNVEVRYVNKRTCIFYLTLSFPPKTNFKPPDLMRLISRTAMYHIHRSVLSGSTSSFSFRVTWPVSRGWRIWLGDFVHDRCHPRSTIINIEIVTCHRLASSHLPSACSWWLRGHIA